MREQSNPKYQPLFSSLLVEALLTGAAEEFLRDQLQITNQERTKPLLECNTFPSDLTKALKDFGRNYAYNSPNVLRIELQGDRVINGLMDFMWKAITDRKDFNKLDSRRRSPDSAYFYSKMSSSYRHHFENSSAPKLPIRYREMQFLTDMISGMTDGFAVALHDDFERAARG